MNTSGSKIGMLTTDKGIDNAMVEIRKWLDKINVSGMFIDLKYDARQNIAMLRFTYNGKDYEFTSTRQSNARLNMHAIARVIEFKVRAHIMAIEQFDTSMSPYLKLAGSASNSKSYKSDTSYSPQAKRDMTAYIILGAEENASNTELIAQYKKMVKTYHPDLASSPEMKKMVEQKLSEINTAWRKIKDERGIE